jgi:hypothetical protein
MPHAGRIRVVLHVVILAIAAASLAACDVVVNSLEGGHAKAEQTWTRSYTLTGADARIEVVNVSGEIDVEATDGGAIDVKAVISVRGASEEAAREALKQVELREEAGPSQVRIETRYPKPLGRQGVSVRYTLRVPKAVSVSVETVNGGVTITGIQAGVRAETTNGNVKGRGLGSAITASTTNGTIDVGMNGLAGDVSLETTNGSIELRLPELAKATVSARCVNGGISVSDLPFERVGEGSRRKLDGRINGGGAALKLETVNGSIRVGRVAS